MSWAATILRQSLCAEQWQVRGNAVLKNRFGPAHAWALWLKELPSCVSFPAESEEIRRYLAGDVLAGDARGWTLVQVERISLGWAKGDGQTLKNHYPKALRRCV